MGNLISILQEKEKKKNKVQNQTNGEFSGNELNVGRFLLEKIRDDIETGCSIISTFFCKIRLDIKITNKSRNGTVFKILIAAMVPSDS